MTLLRAAAAGLPLSWAVSAARAAEYPAPKDGDWTVEDFKFHTGEVLPELHLHSVTIGDPKGEPVVVLHGTTAFTKFYKEQLRALLHTAPKLAM